MTLGSIDLKVVLGWLGIVLEALQELRALPADSLRWRVSILDRVVSLLSVGGAERGRHG